MSKPFFSIIIPAYNAEGHIRTLLNSIWEQVFASYELIIVCDSCTDRTFDIACEYVRPCTNDQVHIVDYGRDGLSRDEGILNATGQWILFADDDDWFVHQFCFQQLHDCIRSQDNDVDLIAFGYECRNRGYIKPERKNVFTPRIDHVWSSCWRRDRIGDAHFGDAVFCSDTYFLRDMKPRVRRFEILDTPIYYYNFMRTGSQTDLFCKGIIRQSPVAE